MRAYNPTEPHTIRADSAECVVCGYVISDISHRRLEIPVYDGKVMCMECASEYEHWKEASFPVAK